MKHIAIEDVEPADSNSPADSVRYLTSALDTENVAINHFELGPGDSIGYAYHRHLDQEEVFFVEGGVVTFQTEQENVEVGPGEIVRFAPGEFQLGRNRGEERARVLAIGAPRETSELEYLLECPICEERTIHDPELSDDRSAFLAYCRECGERTREIVL